MGDPEGLCLRKLKALGLGPESVCKYRRWLRKANKQHWKGSQREGCCLGRFPKGQMGARCFGGGLSWAGEKRLDVQSVKEGAPSGYLHIKMYGPSREPLKSLEEWPRKAALSLTRLTRNTSVKQLLGLENIKPLILTYPLILDPTAHPPSWLGVELNLEWSNQEKPTMFPTPFCSGALIWNQLKMAD